MAIATRVRDFMAEHGLRYDVLSHPHSHCSSQTAQYAHVPGDSLAKCVVLEDDHGYLMAVLPSTRHVQLGMLGKALSGRVRLVGEDELGRLFADCEPGAIPPMGAAYGMRMVVDDSLAQQAEIYFEAGDHERVIQMSREDFMAMMEMERASTVHFGEHTWRHH
ncbi:YbaK/EbsC family protein [Thauera sp. CAU 1555]|uniref:YbaK/EbsC family protein n=1 Tax=Thauera sedimentorum TaxID=2767595 RepID=A0ABR9BA02_9RHOO|nr:YbaK/EbsC family protein [Thauera sedimentorum]MBC9072102.1 YbaK/EbsC family protein [Thauera sedimentorum]MBD8503021.1 YbaK/EbsC family protein [Thauera sedimentorum]